MNEYIYVLLKINKITGEVMDMSEASKSNPILMEEVQELYKKLNINNKSNKKPQYNEMFKEYTKYDYYERTTLDNSTYAKI